MNYYRRIQVLLLLTLIAGSVAAHGAGRRRALLVGINDYTASRIGTRARMTPVPGRDWPNLRGAAGDAHAMAEILTLLYGFDQQDVIMLTDQDATRDAILQTLEQHLVQPAAKEDTLFFYFAGHGSQVRNSLAPEPDKLDESIVPADSRLGTRDIRDKELQSIFNRILARGAKLTILLDNCHSGSGARGLASGAQPRGIHPDLRDVADGADRGPLIERNGALVLSATSDFDSAWEMRDEQGTFHGAFSWAWMRAIRDAATGESADQTFLRAEARLRAETPYQEPVLEGNGPQRLSPFLGTRSDRQDGRTVIAVERVRDDGTVVLRGGWANGLSIGTRLGVVSNLHLTVRLIVTAIFGLTQSEARVEAGRSLPQAVRSGALLEVVSWAPPPGRPLRVWAPRGAASVDTIATVANAMSAAADRRGVRWVTDPTDDTPTHLLRRNGSDWELLAQGRLEKIGSDSEAVAAIAKLAKGSSLFVQLPAPAALVDPLGIGPGSDAETIQPIDQPEEADYVLAGRFKERRLSYAWVRPLVRKLDRRKTGLPVRSTWIAADARPMTLRTSAATLREQVLRIRRIHSWHVLESPPDFRFAYRLALRRVSDGVLVQKDAALTGGEQYTVALRTTPPAPARVPPRSVYVFVIDSNGQSTLLFPPRASVENFFPLPPAPGQSAVQPPIEIQLVGKFEVGEPYGVDTFFLLSTDSPLPNPWILEWDGVAERDARPESDLEHYLVSIDSGDRTPRMRILPPSWSIERVPFEAVAPRARSAK